MVSLFTSDLPSFSRQTVSLCLYVVYLSMSHMDVFG